MKTLSIIGICLALITPVTNASWSIVDLGNIKGDSLILPKAINDNGQITGSYLDNTSHWSTFLTDSNGSNIRDITPFVTGGNYHGSDINNSGKILGNIVVFEPFKGSELHTLISSNNGDEMRDLMIDFNGDSLALGVATKFNDSGQLTGSYLSKEHRGIISFIADEDGSNLRNIGSLAGSSATRPIEINNSGRLLGIQKMEKKISTLENAPL